MFPMNEIPKYNIGDWVEINNTCLVGQYIGKIVQVTDINTPATCFGRFEYTCKITEDHDQVFWETELTLSKVIPIMGEIYHDKRVLTARTVEKKSEEKEEEEEPTTIWV